MILAPTAFKVLEFIVLLKHKGEPILRMNFTKNKAIQNGYSRPKNALIDDMAPNALKARQFIVLLKTIEGHPFLDFF